MYIRANHKNVTRFGYFKYLSWFLTEIRKNYAKVKQNPAVEILLFENYLLPLPTFLSYCQWLLRKKLTRSNRNQIKNPDLDIETNQLNTKSLSV